MLLCAIICDARVGKDVRDVHGRDLGMEMGKHGAVVVLELSGVPAEGADLVGGENRGGRGGRESTCGSRS